MVRLPPALAVVVGAVAVLAVSAMSSESAPTPDRSRVPAPPAQGSTTPTIRLEAVPDAAGISFVHQFGAGGDHIVESGGSGAAWIDYDVDGDVDVLMVNGLSRRDGNPDDGRGHALFRNLGGVLAPAPAHSGVADRVWGAGVAVADVDNDGFPDLLITAVGPDRLYRNNGDGTFSAWDAGLEDDGWSTSAAFTDWDQDGFVDLYIARYLAIGRDAPPVLCFLRGVEVFCGPQGRPGLPDLFYRNTGAAKFVRWFEKQVDPNGNAGFAVVATDCDDDLRPEIYVANDSQINLLYRRTNGGGIEDWALFGGVGYNGEGREQAGMATAVADIDGDGLFDLFVTNFQNDHNTIYHNLGGCNFEDVTARLGLAAGSLAYMGWGAVFADFDGDADNDLFIANGHIYPQLDALGEPFAQHNLLYANQLRETGRVGFVEVDMAAATGMAQIESSRGVAYGDYDDDGDTDVLITNINAPPTLLRNESRLQAPAIRLTLIGRSSNRSAYGARVRVVSGDVEQFTELRGSDGYIGSNDPRLLIHLPSGVADRIEIDWPSGARTTLEREPAGWLVVDEQEGVIARR
ncbi:MAG: CRTAC1 family protein [Acidobacteria bacterium]|nr:CRTAC1 family protein [Acidobacteriota bacterium]